MEGVGGARHRAEDGSCLCLGGNTRHRSMTTIAFTLLACPFSSVKRIFFLLVCVATVLHPLNP